MTRGIPLQVLVYKPWRSWANWPFLYEPKISCQTINL
jgi:hypothetical protein